MATVTCNKVIDPKTGAVTYQEVQQSSNSLVDVLTAIQNAGPQASSYSGVGLATAIASAATYLPAGSTDAASQVAGAVLSGLTGNIPGAVLGGIAAGSALLSIIRNENSPARLTNEQIQSVVSSLSQSQLISLLDSHATSPATINAGNGSGSSAASQVQPAVTTVHN